MKAFISQPMKGYSDEQILEQRNAIIKAIHKVNETIEVIDSFIDEVPDDSVKNKALWYLGKSVSLLADADVFVDADFDGVYHPGCEIELMAANEYGIPVWEFMDGELYVNKVL